MLVQVPEYRHSSISHRCLPSNIRKCLLIPAVKVWAQFCFPFYNMGQCTVPCESHSDAVTVPLTIKDFQFFLKDINKWKIQRSFLKVTNGTEHGKISSPSLLFTGHINQRLLCMYIYTRGDHRNRHPPPRRRSPFPILGGWIPCFLCGGCF